MPSGESAPGVVAHLFLQAGHADFEEFVEIAAGDADEAESFEKRYGGVGGLREHTFVETQNAQFAIQEGVADGHRQREEEVRKRTKGRSEILTV